MGIWNNRQWGCELTTMVHETTSTWTNQCDDFGPSHPWVSISGLWSVKNMKPISRLDFFSWTLQAPIICLVWSLDSDGHYFPRHEMPGIEVVTRTAWGGDGRGWLCSSTGVFLGVPSQVVPSSKPVEVFQKNADFESEVVALLGRRGWAPLQRCRFQQKALILEWVSPKLRNSEVFN